MVQTYLNFPGEGKCARAHQNSPGEFSQNSERTQFSRRKNYHKNTYDFPGDLIENFIRTHKHFPEERNTIRTDQIFQESFLKIL